MRAISCGIFVVRLLLLQSDREDRTGAVLFLETNRNTLGLGDPSPSIHRLCLVPDRCCCCFGFGDDDLVTVDDARCFENPGGMEFVIMVHAPSLAFWRTIHSRTSKLI